MRDKPALKKRLIGSILGSLREIKPPNWALTDHYNTYIQANLEDTNWTPEMDYYASLVSRFVDGNALNISDFDQGLNLYKKCAILF